MTIDETRKLLAVIKTAYPEFNKELQYAEHKSALKLWHKMLAPYNYDECDTALALHIKKCKFAPKISEIHDIVKVTDDPFSFKKGDDGDEWQCRSWVNISENLGIPLEQWQIVLINRHSHLRQRLMETPSQQKLLNANH